MSDEIKHECGIALIRLLKPFDYYQKKYGSALYGIKKLYLLMQKQHNRGQDGAGVGVIKFDPKPGDGYIFRQRANGSSAIPAIFEKISESINNSGSAEQIKDPDYLKENSPFIGELLLGHLRYGTHGENSTDLCHPFIRDNNWMNRNLVLAGNFNLTNVDELFDLLVDLGQHPREKADTVLLLEKIGHFLDEEVQRNFTRYKLEGHPNKNISNLINKSLDIKNILIRSLKEADGGYVMAGMIGHGDAFVVRDPNGIRPCYYYYDDEIAVVTSERPAIMTGFNISYEKIKELEPGHAIIIRKDGTIDIEEIVGCTEKKSCSFERIYFSRGNDKEIYRERKRLGYLLGERVLDSVNFELKNTVFSYIPNTAAVAFYGLIDGMNDSLNKWKLNQILNLGSNPGENELREILATKLRRESLAVKDAKIRTFITDDLHREDLVAHVYDVTYGLINSGIDTMVMMDDSIVRGTTLKTSILRILDRLHPKKVIIVSSAPQIRYPDCYGIDMSKMGDFIAFQAMIELLKDNKMEGLMQEVYRKCKEQEKLPTSLIQNCVKLLYEPFTADQISKKIAQIVKPVDMKAEVDIIYNSLENLHLSCPEHSGDWYFSGNYPTPGGNKVVNRAYINYIEGSNVRAY